MKIIRIDRDGNESVAYDEINTRAEAVNRLYQFCQEEARLLCNAPHIEQNGPNELAVYVGLYRQISFRLEE